mmetsp:Transcript_27592/g.69563  ORF Transcript_27592/g.69563 Transcript_27592/m.69563 type:complete len:310 (+) Transcript_27592:1331-2260(+)
MPCATNECVMKRLAAECSTQGRELLFRFSSEGIAMTLARRSGIHQSEICPLRLSMFTQKRPRRFSTFRAFADEHQHGKLHFLLHQKLKKIQSSNIASLRVNTKHAQELFRENREPPLSRARAARSPGRARPRPRRPVRCEGVHTSARAQPKNFSNDRDRRRQDPRRGCRDQRAGATAPCRPARPAAGAQGDDHSAGQLVRRHAGGGGLVLRRAGNEPAADGRGCWGRKGGRIGRAVRRTGPNGKLLRHQRQRRTRTGVHDVIARFPHRSMLLSLLRSGAARMADVPTARCGTYLLFRLILPHELLGRYR